MAEAAGFFMKILYFSQAAAAAGCREEEWKIDAFLTLDFFWEEAIRRHPALEKIRMQCRVASGGSYVDRGELLDPGAEAAIIPPVSGG